MTVHRSIVEAVTSQPYTTLADAQAAGDTLTGMEFLWIYQHGDTFTLADMPVLEIGYTLVALKHRGEQWKLKGQRNRS